MVKKLTNGFATKKDILHLEKKMDKRFEQVDRQFVNFRDDLKQDWNFFKSDTFREFEHRWQQKIDPILGEIQYHRQKENLVYEQYGRLVGKIDKIAIQVETLTGNVGKIAHKVGVKL